MKKNKLNNYLKYILLVLFISIIFIIANSCTSSTESTSDQIFTVIEHTDLDIEDLMNQLQATPDNPDEFDFHDLYYEISQETQGIIPYLISHEVVKYTSKDDQGNDIELSGLFIYPYKLIQIDRIQTPLISVNHGTELLKKYAPSKWNPWNISDWGNFAEVIIADIMASRYGWTIVMPDYQGMGYDLTENHPYCVRQKLANATADMVEKGIATIKDNNHPKVNWDGNLFVYGYSEGGFVTMAVTRELEERNVDITGSVCMDGPYDLTGTMLDVMLSDDPFPVPYFLPLMLVGYHTEYPTTYAYEQILKEPYRTDIPKYTNGFYDSDVVNGIMPVSGILKEVFENVFIDTLQDSTSNAYNILHQNDTYPDWIPESNMLLWHCKNDDCVPFGNFEAAKNAFTGAGASNITYVEWPPVNNWAGTVHVSVAPRAFYEGATWIHQQLK